MSRKQYEREIANVKSIPRLELYDWLQWSFYFFTGINYLLAVFILYSGTSLDALMIILGAVMMLLAFVVVRDRRVEQRSLTSVIGSSFIFFIGTGWMIYGAALPLLVALLVELCIIGIRGCVIWRRLQVRCQLQKQQKSK